MRNYSTPQVASIGAGPDGLARCACDAFKDGSPYRDVGLVIVPRNMIAPLLTKEGTGPASIDESIRGRRPHPEELL
jgi:hypothetical protein